MSKQTPPNTYGDRIRLLRHQAGMTQEELGREMGKTKNNISQYECGKREPDVEALLFLARRFYVSLDYLLGLSSRPHAMQSEQQLAANPPVSYRY